MILWPSYLHNGIYYTGKMRSLYWIRAQVSQMPVLLVAGLYENRPPKVLYVFEHKT